MVWEVGETLVSFYGKRGVHLASSIIPFISFMDTQLMKKVSGLITTLNKL
jgi:hypothetical protein